MKYEEYVTKLGTRYDIINGELTESPSGLFVVSEEFKDYTIYINKQNLTATMIAPRLAYIGREYRIKVRDCISLIIDWYKHNRNIDWTRDYNGISISKYLDYYQNGVDSLLIQYGFTEVEDKTNLEIGDFLIYKIDDTQFVNTSMYYGNGKILQQLPDKLSSIDPIDFTKIVRVYRYGN
jgi:hypothetical protein